jgi:hypothetical protein
MRINQQRSGYGSINFEYSGRNIYKFYADKYIKYLSEIKNITLYARYIDDIPIIHDPQKSILNSSPSIQTKYITTLYLVEHMKMLTNQPFSITSHMKGIQYSH